MNKDKEPIIEFCTNCFGTKPCWCHKKNYIKTWKFVFDALKRLKP